MRTRMIEVFALEIPPHRPERQLSVGKIQWCWAAHKVRQVRMQFALEIGSSLTSP